MKMDHKGPAMLLDLAVQSLLSNEPIIIQSLKEIPRELFIPLFTAAFLGGHKKTLTMCEAIVKNIKSNETHSELLEAKFDALQVLPALNSASHKVEQSSGSLHLCCRDLQIDKLSDYKNTLNLLDLLCIDHLAVDQTSLGDITTLLSQMVHLDSPCLSKITLRSLNGKIFKNFLAQLERMDTLQELSLSFFCLTHHLHKLLRVLPPCLGFLNLPFSELSCRDFRFLAQCPQASCLKLVNLSNNPISWEDCEPFQTLIENISGTLQHLEINHCLIIDSTITSLTPALSHCFHLHVLSFASNPITMSMLMRILQNVIPLMELKYMIYPI
ncbi:hypothetical protein A6R68_01614, partial [Neotoma lepida]